MRKKMEVHNLVQSNQARKRIERSKKEVKVTKKTTANNRLLVNSIKRHTTLKAQNFR